VEVFTFLKHILRDAAHVTGPDDHLLYTASITKIKFAGNLWG